MNAPKSGLDYNTLMGITLKSLRRQRNVVQTELMAAANVSRATWSRIENGQSPIDFLQLVAVLSECFGMTLEEFFHYMDDLDERLRQTIEAQAKEKGMDSKKFLYALAAVGVGAVVGFLAKLLLDKRDES